LDPKNVAQPQTQICVVGQQFDSLLERVYCGIKVIFADICPSHVAEGSCVSAVASKLCLAQRDCCIEIAELAVINYVKDVITQHEIRIDTDSLLICFDSLTVSPELKLIPSHVVEAGCHIGIKVRQGRHELHGFGQIVLHGPSMKRHDSESFLIR